MPDPRRLILGASPPCIFPASPLRPESKNPDPAGEQAQSLNVIRRHLPKDQVLAIVEMAAEQYPEVAAPIRQAKDEAKVRKATGARAGGKARHGQLGDHVTAKLESADAIGRAYGASGATVKREAPDMLPKVAADELDQIVRGEFHENTARKDFLVTEAVAISEAVREVEARAAKARQRHGGRRKRGGKFPQDSAGKTRDKVAAYTGRSGRTLEKAAAYVQPGLLGGAGPR